MTAASSRGTRIGRERLIESHLPLVNTVARRYAGRGESLDDLIQVGAIGLIKASNRFDESRGVAFAAFAAPTIDGEIRRHLRDRSSSLRIPRDLQRTSGEIRRQRTQLAAALGHSPTVGELAAALDTDERQVERALKADLARDAVPLSPERESVGPPDGATQGGGSEDRLSLASSVRTLDERQRAIVFLRFHADMTEREIGRELGLSQAHVSRLLTGALAQLRTELKESSEGTGDGDSSMERAVSPDSQQSPMLSKAPKSETDGATVPQQGARIGGVLASHESRTLAHYLELPYSVAVKSEPKGERPCWTATVEELPGCTAKGNAPDEAVDSLRPAMERWLTAALAEGREIPAPAGQGGKEPAPSSHSGRFLVRMPGALHEQLAREAKHERLSLNRFVTNVLAASVSPTPPVRAGALGLRPDETIEGLDAAGRKWSRAFRVALATNLAVMVLAGVAAIVLLVLALQSGV